MIKLHFIVVSRKQGSCLCRVLRLERLNNGVEIFEDNYFLSIVIEGFVMSYTKDDDGKVGKYLASKPDRRACV